MVGQSCAGRGYCVVFLGKTFSSHCASVHAEPMDQGKSYQGLKVFPFVSDKPENIQLIVNDSNICQGDVISITCSADGKPAVHTYQLFDNDIPVSDGSSPGVWNRTMSTQGVFTYRCVANNTVGTSNENVTVNGNFYILSF